MPLTPMELSKKAKIPPPPVLDTIVSGSKPTEIFTRFLIDLRASGGNVYEEINRVIAQVNLNIEKINKIQVGAGLQDSGDYVVPSGTNYIDSTTSLSDADSTLDTALYDNVRELIVNTTTSLTINEDSQTVICDATSAPLSITLPLASGFYNNNRSKRVAIAKSDTTSNAITIISTSPNLIIGETSQELNSQGDVINLITDGTNWHLGA